MSKPGIKAYLYILTLLLQVVPTFGQTIAPTTGILNRVLLIEFRGERGTIFSVVVDGREYWITAKHILTGSKHPPYGTVAQKQITAKILNPDGPGEDWLAKSFSVIDPGNNIDIAVLTLPHALLSAKVPSLESGENVVLGGDCAFLGYPYGEGWRAVFPNGTGWMPYTKHCAISAFLKTDDGQVVWVLDGINNAGFSGGPVIFGTGSDQKIMAVISGYHTESVEVTTLKEGKAAATHSPGAAKKTPGTPKEAVEINSGFVLAYSSDQSDQGKPLRRTCVLKTRNGF